MLTLPVARTLHAPGSFPGFRESGLPHPTSTALSSFTKASTLPPSSQPKLWVFGKMGCLGNSKTEDQRNEEKAQREANKKIEKQLQKDKQIYRATHRLLLLGRANLEKAR
ncbi:hypothetical protein WMY93_011390 [Mugilogobius chulae]|uniref:Uncharacterized protein n=1 Tax=Mugilogobius chulae TaxID=88201 RepID=A0AAW0PCI5_9GOBI